MIESLRGASRGRRVAGSGLVVEGLEGRRVLSASGLGGYGGPPPADLGGPRGTGL